MHHDFILTKILATLGPASEDPETILRMIQAGARVFRINFSHGSFEDYERLLKAVRAASERAGIPIGVLGDLCGPKIRVGEVVEGGVALEVGARVEFQRAPLVAGKPQAAGDAVVFSTTYPDLIDDVKPQEPVLLDDGKVRLVSVGSDGDGDERRLLCEVVVGGVITSSKGINLPESKLSVPALTEKDQQCLEFAVEKGFDFLALSFVRSGDDVRELKKRLRALDALGEREATGGDGPDLTRGSAFRNFSFLPVFSKIEKPQALDDLKAIVKESNGVMVARGDLGVEMDLAEVPVIQKEIIEICHDYGKPVIVATQMLESMIQSPVPTRAEVSDVANAIFDGADVVMLSGETAIGQWPVKAVEMMNRVAHRTNGYIAAKPPVATPPSRMTDSKYQTAALARGVATIVRDMDAKLVVAWCQLDGSAGYLSRNRLTRPVLACSANPEALRRMSMLYGLKPIYMEEPANAEEFFCKADKLLQEKGWAEKGEPVVFVAGHPIGEAGVTNSVHVHYVGDVLINDEARMTND